VLIAHQAVDGIGVKLGDEGRRPCRPGGYVSFCRLDDEKLLLDARDGSSRRRPGFRDFDVGFGRAGRPDADRADAVCAVGQEQAEIVLSVYVRGACLLFAQPPLRPDMLEEGVKPVAPFVFPPRCGEAAADLLVPAVFIGKARPPGDRLLEGTGGFVLEKDLGDA
jgi:hypothetical protein